MTDSEYRGDPEEFPFVLGILPTDEYTLPGLAGRRAHCHFLLCDDQETWAYTFAIYRGGASVVLMESDHLALGPCIEFSDQ